MKQRFSRRPSTKSFFRKYSFLKVLVSFCSDPDTYGVSTFVSVIITRKSVSSPIKNSVTQYGQIPIQRSLTEYHILRKREKNQYDGRADYLSTASHSDIINLSPQRCINPQSTRLMPKYSDAISKSNIVLLQLFIPLYNQYMFLIFGIPCYTHHPHFVIRILSVFPRGILCVLVKPGLWILDFTSLDCTTWIHRDWAAEHA